MLAAPPPLPAAPAGREALIAELRGLDTPELLALCLRFHRAPERLALYLSVLRGRSGERAQFAACLVCFDLGRLGNAAAQLEFAALTPTVRQLAQDQALLGELLRGDPYLEDTWAQCREALSDADDGFTVIDSDVETIAELDLLSDEEMADVDFEVLTPDLAQAEAEYGAFVIRYLQHDPDNGAITVGRGFSTDTAGEIDRLESFVQAVAERGTRVPAAKGLASLAHLFLGTHLRQRNLFGRPNPRRIAALRSGLRELPEDLASAEKAAEVFAFEGPTTLREFQKVTELLVDYVRFCYREHRHPRSAASVDAYLELDRKPPTLDHVAAGRR